MTKAPFPWFGGKRRAAPLIWPRFGNVPNYVEPFAGSLAVLLNRPSAPGNEIVNDLDCYVANAWRAMKHVPEEVAGFCDWPVNEADLHARHQWLHGRGKFRERMKVDPDAYDARIAGYWIWGLSCWIGDNFCRPSPQSSLPGLTGKKGVARQLPDVVGTHGALTHNGQPSGKGCNGALKLASGTASSGAQGVTRQVPHLSGAQGVTRKVPHLSGEKGVSGPCLRQTEALVQWFESLADRLRFTKVCCGDWARVCTKAATYGQGLTGVLLDPPYDAGESHDDVYGDMSRGVSQGVREWAIENGPNPLLRIALCGYEGEHVMPLDWSCVAWKASGGYGNRREDNDNAERERIWFSPHCLCPEPELFDLSSLQPLNP